MGCGAWGNPLASGQHSVLATLVCYSTSGRGPIAFSTGCAHCRATKGHLSTFRWIWKASLSTLAGSGGHHEGTGCTGLIAALQPLNSSCVAPKQIGRTTLVSKNCKRKTTNGDPVQNQRPLTAVVQFNVLVCNYVCLCFESHLVLAYPPADGILRHN